MDDLWTKRFNAFINERIFILRRLANGFAFLPLLIFLFGLYYYPMFLDWLPLDFPVKILFSVILAWFITRGGFRSFLNGADMVYLPPMEKNLSSYFRKCIFYNIIIQGFFILVILVLLSPLFFARVSPSADDFVVFASIMLIFKSWNIFILWQNLKIESGSYLSARLILNFSFIYGLLLKNIPVLALAIVLLCFFYWGMQKLNKTNRLDWLRMIEIEQQLDTRFYTWIGSFVDHPRVTSKVRLHKLLTKLSNGMSNKTTNAYHYLFLKLFIRTDISGIILRIIFFGMLILWFLPNIYLLLGTYISLLFMIGLQLHGFWYEFANQFWANLYPLTEDNRKQSYLSCSFYILLFSAILLLLPVIINYFTISVLVTFLLIAVVFSYGFVYLYVNKKIHLYLS